MELPTGVRLRETDFAAQDTRELTVSFSSIQDTKEQVKQSTDIVELVGKYARLRRQGRNYVAICPWHDDTRPSLQVNPERQSFKCWVCDIGGDVFSFIMKMEGVEFREALELLADRAGIEIKPLSPPPGMPGVQTAPEGAPAAPNRRTMLQAAAWAEQKYHECLLNSPEAEPARKYLRERGISDESIRKFHVGYSPNRGDWLLGVAREAKANTSVLEAIGILVKRESGGNPFDRFYGRLLFSIRDTQDRPIALGGRVLPSSGSTSPAKYINSPETMLFRKSKTLYGLDLARVALRKNRTVLVTEGYTDCIVAHQYGFDNTVAVLGTALGEQHIRTLSPFADRIVLVLDGDEAGQRRANEVLELFVARQVDLQIVTLPEGADPADFLHEHGAEAFGDLIGTRAVDALEHAFLAKTRGVDLDKDTHAASEALEELVAIVARAPRLRADTSRDDRLREEKVLGRLAFEFRVPEQDVRDRLTALRRRAAQRPAPISVERLPADVADATQEPRGEIDPWQRELLEILVRHPQCLAATRAAIPVEQLTSEPCRLIYQACCRLSDSGVEPGFDRLMLELDDARLKSLLVELDEHGSAKGTKAPEALLQELIESFQARESLRRLPAETGALRQGQLDVSQQADLLADMVRKARGRHGISDPTDG